MRKTIVLFKLITIVFCIFFFLAASVDAQEKPKAKAKDKEACTQQTSSIQERAIAFWANDKILSLWLPKQVGTLAERMVICSDGTTSTQFLYNQYHSIAASFLRSIAGVGIKQDASFYNVCNAFGKFLSGGYEEVYPFLIDHAGGDPAVAAYLIKESIDRKGEFHISIFRDYLEKIRTNTLTDRQKRILKYAVLNQYEKIANEYKGKFGQQIIEQFKANMLKRNKDILIGMSFLYGNDYTPSACKEEYQGLSLLTKELDEEFKKYSNYYAELQKRGEYTPPQPSKDVHNIDPLALVYNPLLDKIKALNKFCFSVKYDFTNYENIKNLVRNCIQYAFAADSFSISTAALRKMFDFRYGYKYRIADTVNQISFAGDKGIVLSVYYNDYEWAPISFHFVDRAMQTDLSEYYPEGREAFNNAVINVFKVIYNHLKIFCSEKENKDLLISQFKKIISRNSDKEIKSLEDKLLQAFADVDKTYSCTKQVLKDIVDGKKGYNYDFVLQHSAFLKQNNIFNFYKYDSEYLQLFNQLKKEGEAK